MHVNEYFANHPDMMLGNMELAGTMRRANEPALIPREGEDLGTALAAAVAKLPENALTPRKVPDSTTIEASAEGIPDYKELKQYGLKVSGGKVYRRMGDGVETQPDYPKKYVQTLKDMLGVRDAAREAPEGRDQRPRARSTVGRPAQAPQYLLRSVRTEARHHPREAEHARDARGP